MRTTFLILLMLALMPAALIAEDPPEPEFSIDQLAWLAGCWQCQTETKLIEEQWMSPKAGVMLGMNRTALKNGRVQYEHLLISEQDGRLVYTAWPSGQKETSFTSVSISPTKIIFENPDHDFPRRIIYQRHPDGSITARIEGTPDDPNKGYDFPMKRVDCPGQ